MLWLPLGRRRARLRTSMRDQSAEPRSSLLASSGNMTCAKLGWPGPQRCEHSSDPQPRAATPEGPSAGGAVKGTGTIKTKDKGPAVAPRARPVSQHSLAQTPTPLKLLISSRCCWFRFPCPGLLIKITLLPSRNQPAQRKKINKHQQEPRQNHRVNQSPVPTPPLQQIVCAGEWTPSPIGANGPAGEALTQNLQTLNIPREFTPPKSMQRGIHTQKHATGSKARELGGGEERRGMDERRSDRIV